MIITIAGPDKISIAMFQSFLKKNLGAGHVIGETHSLMSEEALTTYIGGFLELNPKALFSYYAKRKTKPESLPKIFTEVSDAIVWFNMYDTKYTLVKDEMKFDECFLETWNTNISQMGG